MNDWLSSIEKDYELDILFACEAGSRAWGLAGEHSDFDIRFIYRHRSLKQYLSLKKAQSVMDFQSPFDVSGFDLFKAFELISKSNPSIYEWAFSPIIYKDIGQFSTQLKMVIETNYSPYALFKHYRSLSKRNIIEVSKGSYSLKKQKQLLQAVRAELIRTGIMKTKKVRSPFEFIENAKTNYSNMSSAYFTITEAKRNNELLLPKEVENLIRLLQFSLIETDEENEIPKIQSSIDKLDKWIWKILGI
ncbi:DNA polymerase beta superfamily protein [Bacillus sp. EB600]|uniref:nucleotidyltransferase domain-containing protein n=1 Tax=Bacillus sp. EB600 TaxID=2806345 RepID=UPI00210BEA2E|nr:nucleotidyltransferase domain-containing protein [Bacillus sp. EB600]MCQ6277850.1 nucleotidyltransferase domain-containing protein [Bacillus sp. EB600]